MIKIQEDVMYYQVSLTDMKQRTRGNQLRLL